MRTKIKCLKYSFESISNSIEVMSSKEDGGGKVILPTQFAFQFIDL